MMYCLKEISWIVRESTLTCKEISHHYLCKKQKGIEIRNSLTVKEAKIFIRI